MYTTGVYQMCSCTPIGVYQMYTYRCISDVQYTYKCISDVHLQVYIRCTPTGVYEMYTYRCISDVHLQVYIRCTPTGVYQMCSCTPTGVYEMYSCTGVDVYLHGYSNQQPHLVMCLNPLSTDIAVHGRSQTQEGATADSLRDSHSWVGEQECQRRDLHTAVQADQCQR